MLDVSVALDSADQARPEGAPWYIGRAKALPALQGSEPNEVELLYDIALSMRRLVILLDSRRWPAQKDSPRRVKSS